MAISTNTCDIQWVQQTLRTLGYNPGVSDGMNGVNIMVAVKNYQQDHELEVDGIVGAYTHQSFIDALNLQGQSVMEASAFYLKNFSSTEFACRCGCGLDVVMDLKIFAQTLRDFYGWPLVISSGARCPTVNNEDGGVPDSCHLTGEAFDCYFPGHMDDGIMAEMADFAEGHGIGVIRYPNLLFCHFQLSPRNDFIF